MSKSVVIATAPAAAIRPGMVILVEDDPGRDGFPSVIEVTVSTVQRGVATGCVIIRGRYEGTYSGVFAGTVSGRYRAILRPGTPVDVVAG
jgi:hypothetical protein